MSALFQTHRSRDGNNDLSLLLQSKALCALHNADSSRTYAPNLEKRSEGWTEVWGEETKQETNSDDLPSLLLIQYRPAWLEQCVLNIAGIPHVVMNSPYMAMELTGPLPCLENVHKPAMVGRHDPSVLDKDNCILDYLETNFPEVHLDRDLNDDSPTSTRDQSFLFKNLISTKLSVVLDVLTFEDDITWRQVYRPQCLKASRGKGGGSCWFLGPLQARTEVILAKRRTRGLSAQQATAMAIECYNIFEKVLSQQNFLATKAKPTLVDAMLWSHLANALGNVQLISILQDYPHLVSYFERIFQDFFITVDKDWKAHNMRENCQNAFFDLLPYVDDETSQESVKQTLSRSLQHVLEQQQQQHAKRIPENESVFFQTWNTWRMGGNIWDGTTSRRKELTTEKERSPVEQMKKAHKKQDEQWMSIVAGTGILAIVLLLRTASESKQGA